MPGLDDSVRLEIISRRYDKTSTIDDIKTIDLWQRYRITHDIFQPAASFDLEPADTEINRKIIANRGGQRIQIYSHEAQQLNGYIDERSESIATDAADLRIGGRATASVLLDSTVDPADLDVSGLTLQRAVERWVAPWLHDEIPAVLADAGVSRYIMAAGTYTVTKTELKQKRLPMGYTVWEPVKTRITKRKHGKFGKSSPGYAGVNTEALKSPRLRDGVTVWEAIQWMAEQVGVHVWQGPDGSLHLARPCYKFDPSAYGKGLVLFRNSNERRASFGNIEECRLETSIAQRASQYRIVSAVKKKKNDKGADLFHTRTIKDLSPAFWQHTAPHSPSNPKELMHKPRLINARKLSDAKAVSRMARREMTRNAIQGFSYEILVDGHKSPGGALWVPDSVVNTYDDRSGISGPMYITKVERRFDMQSGAKTLLALIPPNVWLGEFEKDSVSAAAFDQAMADRIWW